MNKLVVQFISFLRVHSPCKNFIFTQIPIFQSSWPGCQGPGGCQQLVSGLRPTRVETRTAALIWSRTPRAIMIIFILATYDVIQLVTLGPVTRVTPGPSRRRDPTPDS